jgi:uncharacterized repeat protein (TIGR01451 family)
MKSDFLKGSALRQRSLRHHHPGWPLFSLLLLGAGPLAAQSSSSPSYALDSPFFTVAGGLSGSPSHSVQSCFTHDPAGSASSASYSVTVGCGVMFLSRLLPPTLAKAFVPPSVDAGGTSTLTISLGNPNSLPITGATFTDSFPTGLQIAQPPNVVNSCGGSVSASPGEPSVGLSGGTIPPGGCSVSVNVRSTGAGVLTNTMPAGAVQSIDAPPNAQGAQARLESDTQVPALAPWGLGVLAGLLAAAGARLVRRPDRSGT